MPTYTWKAKVRLSNNTTQEVRVQADSPSNAKAMLESQYGKGSITFGPVRG